MSMIRPVQYLLLIGIMASCSACATAEIGRKITPEEVAWIQKGVSTRSEVVQRIGAPMSEGPDWGAMTVETTSTTTTTKEGGTQKSVTTSTVRPANKFTRALYLHTKSEGGLLLGIKTTQEQFWVTYDEQGVVQDFGFGGGTSMTVR